MLIRYFVVFGWSVFLVAGQNSIGGQANSRDALSSTESRDVWAATDTKGENGTGMVHARVGMMIPHGLPLLDDKFGYATSGGAVSLALDRVMREGLLSHVQWRFHVSFSQCEEATAVGELIKLVEEEHCNVIIGPPCSITAVPSAVVAKFYNIPIFSWAATSVVMADANRFNTLVRVISSSLRLGRALRELLSYFNWKRFALFFTDDKATRNCYSIAEGLRKAIAKVNVVNVYNLAIDSSTVTDEQIERFLSGMTNFARIAIVCLEHEEDMRRFMLRAQEKGMTEGDYVYIMPDYVRDQNRSEQWTQYTAKDKQDTRDAEAKAAFKPVMFLEMKLSSSDEVHYFKKQIVQRIKEYPFYYDSTENSNTANQQYGSLYSPFLHDAVYLYALALNRTIEAGGNINTGTWIMNTTRGVQFLGVSGHVVIDETGGREPNFLIRGFDENMKMTTFAEALMYKSDGDTIHLLVPERLIWDARGGIVPVDVPRCGFYGELCIKKRDSNFVVYAIAGAVFLTLVIVLIVILLISYIRKSLVQNEMSKMLWKVPFHDLDYINDRSKRSSSVGSANTITTTASDETAEALAKGHVNIAHLRGVLVWCKEHQGSMVLSSHADHEHMKAMRDITNDNLNLFHGLCLDAPKPCSVWKYQSKGSLEDVLHNDNFKLDWFFKYSLIKDVANGMEYLHSTAIGSHGRLRSSNCLVDHAWVLKITDYGLHRMRVNKKEAKEKLWTAPEFLRMIDPPLQGSLEGDVYSFSIVVQEILCRDRPYCNDNLTPGDVILRVAKAESPPFRPTVNIGNSNEADPAMVQLMNDCWKEDPSFRPTFHSIKSQVRTIGRGRRINLMDHALKMMEKFTANLEQTMADRTKQMTDELKKADTMVYQLLPKSIADRMRAGQIVEPELYQSASIIVVEMGNFLEMMGTGTALQTVNMLNDVQANVNEVINKYDCYRVESLGSGIVAVSGAPERNENHAQVVADLGLNLVTSAADGDVGRRQNVDLKLRVAIHTGPVNAGVAGTAVPVYSAFGVTVDVAQRLEETGKISCVHMSETTHEALQKSGGGYVTKPRGEIVIKGHGVMFTYWLLGKNTNQIFDNTSDTTSARSAARTSNTDLRSVNSVESGMTKGTSRAESVVSGAASLGAGASENEH